MINQQKLKPSSINNTMTIDVTIATIFMAEKSQFSNQTGPVYSIKAYGCKLQPNQAQENP